MNALTDFTFRAFSLNELFQFVRGYFPAIHHRVRWGQPWWSAVSGDVADVLLTLDKDEVCNALAKERPARAEEIEAIRATWYELRIAAKVAAERANPHPVPPEPAIDAVLRHLRSGPGFCVVHGPVQVIGGGLCVLCGHPAQGSGLTGLIELAGGK